MVMTLGPPRSWHDRHDEEKNGGSSAHRGLPGRGCVLPLYTRPAEPPRGLVRAVAAGI